MNKDTIDRTCADINEELKKNLSEFFGPSESPKTVPPRQPVEGLPRDKRWLMTLNRTYKFVLGNPAENRKWS